MSESLSTIQDFGIGFERSGFLDIPSSLNQIDRWSEEDFEESISQLPWNQLPPGLRRSALGQQLQGGNEPGFCPPSDVLESWIQTKVFDGLLFIPDAPFVFPPQRFVAFSQDNIDVLESHPTDDWPQIRVELKRKPNATPTVQRFLLRPSGNTINSEILYTRAHYTVSKMGSCVLISDFTDDDQVVGIPFSFEPLSDQQEKEFLYRAKIARKLKFIETIFNISVTLPENITPDHVQYLETIFRGLTEGQFVSRGNGTTVFVRAADINLAELPLASPGPFRYCFGTEQALLFPQHILDVGPYYLILNRAIVANQALLSSLREGKDSWVRFEVLDGQITYRYEKYLKPERHKLVKQKLNRFYSDLLLAETPELARTLLEPLIADVLQDAAILIAVGWLQYHNFADRFSAQEPILEAERSVWRVPIYVAFPSGKNSPVGEILIDLKTGAILDEPSPELLRQKGLTEAEKILRAG